MGLTILEVSKEDDIKEIEKKFKKMRSIFHTDNNGGGSSFMFRMIKSAFEKIKKDQNG